MIPNLTGCLSVCSRVLRSTGYYTTTNTFSAKIKKLNYVMACSDTDITKNRHYWITSTYRTEAFPSSVCCRQPRVTDDPEEQALCKISTPSKKDSNLGQNRHMMFLARLIPEFMSNLHLKTKFCKITPKGQQNWYESILAKMWAFK